MVSRAAQSVAPRVVSALMISAVQLVESNKSIEPDLAVVVKFNLRMLFLITVVVAVSAATWGGLTREDDVGLLAILDLVRRITRR